MTRIVLKQRKNGYFETTAADQLFKLRNAKYLKKEHKMKKSYY
jgi:hypothetical protein